MGKYSKALEKAKDETIHNVEPIVEQPPAEQPEEAILETTTVQATEVDPVESPPVEMQEPDIPTSCGQMEDWDAKLREIISGNSRQVAESIRMLRTKIFHPAEGAPPKTLLVTSSVPGEGKSFVCANLGVSISQGIEQKALLVDCDLRKPNLAKILGLQNSRGIVDYLQNGTPVEQLIQQTCMPNLSVLASGKPPKNPAELIDSQKMSSFIESLANQLPNQTIIIDSPPIQAASETDILAKKVDGVILVVRWGYARREHVKQLIEMIGREKIIGIVFNAFEMSRLESKLQGYYYGYKDYYSSSYSKYYK